MNESDELPLLRRKLARERKAREEAETLLEAKARELHERNRELRRSNEELERFAYAASHDLRAPLRTIAGFSDLLQRKEAASMSDSGREFLELIQEAVSQMDNLIEDLLQFSRANRVEVNFEPIDLAEVIDDASDRLRSLIEQQSATIEVGPLPQVSGHAGLLTRLFQNLISNGCKFARPGVPPVVRISAAPDGDQVCVRVEDNGIGIEPEYQEQIFQMFARLHNADDYPGTGIGLALCTRIVERHSGRIDVVSQPGEGATFRVWLPGPAGGGS
ncbi:ATP-binding protein [uncultured Abyssibacter sp.]|uniref:sensor histidine kinase n=1 Tax=uncultured Abyssibacter sp. TaxID=2320202 RepID=UPI0032B1CEC9